MNFENQGAAVGGAHAMADEPRPIFKAHALADIGSSYQHKIAMVEIVVSQCLHIMKVGPARYN